MKARAWHHLGALAAALSATPGFCNVLGFDGSVPDYRLVENSGNRCVVEVSRPAKAVSGAGLRERQTTAAGKTVYVFDIAGSCKLTESAGTLALDTVNPAPLARTASTAAVPSSPSTPAASALPAPLPSFGASAPSARAPSAPMGETAAQEMVKKEVAAALEKAEAEKDQPTPKDNFAKYTVDLTPVESPAFVLIGASTENVSRPATPREWSAAIVNGIDRTAKPKAGVSIETAPYQLLNPYLPREEYAAKGRWGLRALNNTQVSMATVQGTGSEDKSLKLALGISIPLFDRGDLAADNAFWECEREERDKANAATPQAGFTPFVKDSKDPKDTKDVNALVKSVQNAYQVCARKPEFAVVATDRWNRSASSIAYGESWTSDTGTFGGAKSRSKGGWFSYAYGFEGMPALQDRAQAIFHIRRLLDERVADPADAKKLVSQDSSVVGLKLRLGTSHVNGSIEATYQRLRPEGKDEDKIRRFALGLEYKLANNMWLVSSIGGEGGRKNGESNAFVLGALRIGSCTAENCRLK